MQLIDRDALIQRIDKGVGVTGIGLEPVMAIRDIKELISTMPTVDAEPVVRCKDCWKCGYDNCPMDDWLDTHWIDNEFFCSLGEPYEMRPGLYRGVKMGRGEKYGKAD